MWPAIRVFAKPPRGWGKASSHVISRLISFTATGLPGRQFRAGPRLGAIQAVWAVRMVLPKPLQTSVASRK